MTPVRDLGASIDLFMGELALRKRTSETRRTYERILFQLADEVGSRKRPDEVTPGDCRRFLRRWNDSAPATLALYVSCLKRFFEFLRDEGQVDTNPMERIHRRGRAGSPARCRPQTRDDALPGEGRQGGGQADAGRARRDPARRLGVQ